MSSKLDQPLDSIITAHKKNARQQRRVPRRGAGGAKPVSAPVGGVKKAVKPLKKVAEKIATPTGPSRSDSKILVSNLPTDVKEAQIKEYFQKSVGPVKRVILSYGPNGVSRGAATVIFHKGESANKAVKDHSGVKVDGKPMKIDVVVDGKDAPPIPEPKKLSDRISQPKNAAKPKPQPKSAVVAKDSTKQTGRGSKPAGRGGRGKRPGARTKKTAEELDAEMTDYFTQNNQENSAPAATADTNMDI